MKWVQLGCRWLVTCALCAGVTGCHKSVPVPVPPVAPTTTVPLTQAPEPDKPVLVQSMPVYPTPLPSKPVQPVRVKKVRKKVAETPAVAGAPAPSAPVPVPAPAPAQVANAGAAPAESVIGSLTAGGDAAPAEKQKAADEIVLVEKRLGTLSQNTLDDQKEGLLRVRSFLRQAHEALKSGDADGANTLATKAEVLLDDLLK